MSDFEGNIKQVQKIDGKIAIKAGYDTLCMEVRDNYIQISNNGTDWEKIISLDEIKGKDGYTPTIEVSDIEGGHRITIDSNGEIKAIDVMDGITPTIHKLTFTGAIKGEYDGSSDKFFNIPDYGNNIEELNNKENEMSEKIGNLNSKLSALGLSVQNGMLCMTYGSEE